jgi:hypothetical protein
VSETLSLVCKFKPSKPAAPVTSNENDAVRIDWQAPFDGGSFITAYRVVIRTTGGSVYEQDLNNCDGSLT